MESVTLVVTSRKRFDLLERTLSSFSLYNDFPLARTIVVEDSDDEGVFDVVRKLGQPNVEVILNGTSLGQHRSIDKAYASVRTEYIFHCEDDWVFERGGIVRESLAVLESDPNILMVTARRREDMPFYFSSIPLRETGGARYRKVGPKVHPLWFTFSFNPGLRRLSDYRHIPGGYASQPGEGDISQFYKRHGRAMAWLEDARVTHIGDDRSNSRRVRPPFGWATLERRARRARSWTHIRMGHYTRLLGLSDGF